MPHKSASILTKLEGDRQVIAKVNGKYWMYWGELRLYLQPHQPTWLIEMNPLVPG